MSDIPVISLLSSPAVKHCKVNAQPECDSIIDLLSSDNVATASTSSPPKSNTRRESRWHLSSDSGIECWSPNSERAARVAEYVHTPVERQDSPAMESSPALSLNLMARPASPSHSRTGDFDLNECRDDSSVPTKPGDDKNPWGDSLDFLSASPVSSSPPHLFKADTVVEPVAVQPENVNPPVKRRRAGTRAAKPVQAQVLKKHWSRMETVRDMICHFYTADQARWATLAQLLREENVTVNFEDTLPAEIIGSAPGTALLIRLQRSTKDQFDPENHYFVRASQQVIDEPYQICVLDHDELPRNVEDAFNPAWAQAVAALSSRSETGLFANRLCTIFLVEGLKQAIKKYQGRYNRALQREVRAALAESNRWADSTAEAGSSSGSQTAPSATQNLMIPNVLYRSILKLQARLQLRHAAQILYPESSSDSHAWIRDLVRDISVKRYSQRVFNPNIIGRRYPSVAEPSLTDLLRPVPGISPAVALQIHAKYGTMKHLSSAAEQNKLDLSDVRGGSALVQRRLQHLLTCAEPNAKFAVDP